MTDLEILERAKMYIVKMANGINPITDEQVKEEDTLNNVRVSRCLFYVSGVLDKVINQGIKAAPRSKKEAFSITSEDLEKFQYSEYPIYVSAIVNQLNILTTKENVKKINSRMISIEKKLNTLEDKKNESNLALNLSFADIIPLVGICSLLIVSFGFTSSFKAYSIIFVILGLLFACWYIRYALFDVVYSIKSFFSKAGNLIKKKHDERLSKKPINAKNKEIEKIKLMISELESKL